jgi:hypothetical protein
MDPTFEQDNTIGRRRKGTAGQMQEFGSFHDEDQQMFRKEYGTSGRTVLRFPAGEDSVALNQ